VAFGLSRKKGVATDNGLEEFTILTGVDHPETGAWGPAGAYYAGGEAGQVYRIDAGKGRVEQVGPRLNYPQGEG